MSIEFDAAIAAIQRELGMRTAARVREILRDALPGVSIRAPRRLGMRLDLDAVNQALIESRGDVELAAESLGVSVRRLYAWCDIVRRWTGDDPMMKIAGLKQKNRPRSL